MVSIIQTRVLLIRIDNLGRDGREVETWDVFRMIGFLIGKFLLGFGC